MVRLNISSIGCTLRDTSRQIPQWVLKNQIFHCEHTAKNLLILSDGMYNLVGAEECGNFFFLNVDKVKNKKQNGKSKKKKESGTIRHSGVYEQPCFRASVRCMSEVNFRNEDS